MDGVSISSRALYLKKKNFMTRHTQWPIYSKEFQGYMYIVELPNVFNQLLFKADVITVVLTGGRFLRKYVPYVTVVL